LLKPKPRTSAGAERETVPKSKRAKLKKKLENTMMPNLSGIKFEDAVKHLLNTPPPKRGKKP
jgi:hypothetical protein